METTSLAGIKIELVYHCCIRSHGPQILSQPKLKETILVKDDNLQCRTLILALIKEYIPK